MVQKKRQRLNLIIDPRFSGGTSAAVAREIYALAPLCELSVSAISSRLFKGKDAHPSILRACDDMHVPLVWDPAMISADLVAVHNPSFLRPDGPEGFDVGHCLGLISQQTVARKKYLSPVSPWNRRCAETWLASHPARWELAPLDWTNICDFECAPPTSSPIDRRGRHSRAGSEKFPPVKTLKRCSHPPAHVCACWALMDF